MPRLYVENGRDRGKSYEIEGDGPFLAGRDPAVEMPIPDEMVSRRHFQIERHHKVHQISDLGSGNGTFLNGHRVRKPEPLTANDRIQSGETIITFLADEPFSLIGQELGGYRILDRIGRGGMGTVYRALQLSLDRTVALKILAPHLVKNTNFINLFIREARAAGALSHPNIVQVYDVGVHEDVYYFAMEYIPHGSVEEILNRQGRLSVPQALGVIRDSALGLQYAEHKGMIHRDIKPGNLMMGAGGITKIGDLGIARSTGGEERVSQKDGVSGSPHYIAPEQARGKDIDHRVDIYALGVSFYHMLAGKTPFTGSTPREVVLKQIKEDAPSLRERVPHVPSEVAQLVEHMMQKDPDARTPSASALLEELEPLIARYGAESSTPEPQPSVAWRRIATLAGSLLLLVLLGVGLALAYEHVQKNQRQHEARMKTIESDLELAARHLDDGRLDDADIVLQRLEQDMELSDDFAGKRDRVRQRQRLLVQEQADQAREKAANDALTKLLSERKPPYGEADVTKLRDLVAAYPGTIAAENADKEARRLTQDLERLRKLSADAGARLDSLSDVAQVFLQVPDSNPLLPPDFNRALAKLMEFESEKYAETDSYSQWKEQLRVLEDRVREHWGILKIKLEEEIGAGRAADARSRIRSFRSKSDAFRELVTVFEELGAMESRIDAIIAASRHGQERPEATAALREGLVGAWERVRILKIPSARTRLPALSEVTPAESDVVKRHRDFLARMRTVLTAIESWSPPTKPRIIELALDENASPHLGRELRVQLRSISIERVVYRVRDKELDDFSLWSELTRETRVKLLLGWVENDEQRLFVGFFAHVNGRSERGDELWSAITDGQLSAEVEELRRLFDLVRGARPEGDPKGD